jgi:endonuclease/exonuclease/phosphatase family metal-dependent hydrolase
MRVLSAALLTMVVVAACSGNETPAAASPQSVSVMAFNVQNLFDTVDAPGKDDKAYLPLEAKQNDEHIFECNEIAVESWRNECLDLDWDDDALHHKLTVIAATILQVNDGRGPDIVALQEIENVDVLEQLRADYLAAAGYLPAVLIDGTDVRGVDVAVLSRLPVSNVTLHPLELPADFAERQGDVRGLLQATFELPGGASLTGFSVHFPAPFHPTEMRVIAYEHLTHVLATVPETHNVFAAGDFNTTSTEDAEQNMLDRFVRPHWDVVSNDLCEGCKGTHYYSRGDTWSFLDMILFAPSGDEESAWQVRGVELAAELSAQLNSDGSPQRYISAERKGVSDHLPVLMTLEERP